MFDNNVFISGTCHNVEENGTVIRRKFGMPGKHPASLCQNKDGMNCHNCGGACHNEDYKQFPGYQYDFVGGNCDAPAADTANADAELVAKITKQVMAQLGLK